MTRSLQDSRGEAAARNIIEFSSLAALLLAAYAVAFGVLPALAALVP